MAEVGDRVEVKSKSGPRLGVVIGVSGSLLTLRWDTGEETTIVPGAGVLSVVPGRPTRATKKAAPRSTGTKRPAAKKAGPTKKAAAPTTRAKNVTKKSPAPKRSSTAKPKGKKKGKGGKKK